MYYIIVISTPPPCMEEVFLEPMYIATKSIKYGFDNIMYQQIDGISTDSSLGTIANIFVGYYEDKLFEMAPKPTHYTIYQPLRSGRI